MTGKLMKLTDEQAVKILLWLGWKQPTKEQMDSDFRRPGNNPALWLITPEGAYFAKAKAVGWLYSDGQEAIIGKLLLHDMGIRLTFQNRGSLGYLCTIHQVLTWEALGETYQEALSQAVLKLFEAWEK